MTGKTIFQIESNLKRIFLKNTGKRLKREATVGEHIC